MRFAVEDPAKVTSPPYDLISDADVEVLLDSHPNNVVRLILPCSSRSNSSPTTATHDQPESPATTAQHQAAPLGTATHSPTASPPSTPLDPAPPPSTPQNPATPPSPVSLTWADSTSRSAALSPDEAADPGPQPTRQSGQAHFRPDPASPTGETPIDPRYAAARDTLREWLDSGVLVPDDVPALYVYEQSGPGVLQRGLIGDVGLVDPGQRIILPHEDVFPGPIADRLALMSTTQANLEPIFLLYDGTDGTATRLVDEVASTRRPLVSANTEDGLTHRLWAITAPEEIAAVNADLHDRQALIADGHHRYATYRVLQRQERATHRNTSQHPEPPAHSASQLHGRGSDPAPQHHGHSSRPASERPPHGDASSPSPEHGESTCGPGHFGQTPENSASASAPGHFGQTPEYSKSVFGPWDFGLALLVDSRAYPPDLQPIHRVIEGLPPAEAVSRAKSSWQVHDYKDLAAGLAALEQASEPAFLLAGENGAHLLTDPDPVQLARAMPPDHSDRWNSLNTSVLSEFVLPVVWGMRDNDQTVRIVHHDTEAAVRLAIRTGGTAVILKPLAVDDVLAIAAGGERVPRKSTSFGPKPRTGLVLRTFATD
ncbi:DUF1015 family protein [[Actinomadura] parvosata]|uniref:DUF1015 family protein n=1 Tax=[Actinomadura] parvosata TaxID=1955412 RepID=UPI00406CD294